MKFEQFNAPHIPDSSDIAQSDFSMKNLKSGVQEQRSERKHQAPIMIKKKDIKMHK